MLVSVAAAAVTARVCGYPSVATLIETEALGPARIVRLFEFSLAADGAQSCALILLAGGTARRR